MKAFEGIKTEDLEREIAARKAAKDEQEKPKPLHNPDFKPLIASCVAAIEKIEKEGDPEGDSKHWIYEAGMEAVFGKGVWNWIRDKNT